MMISTDQVAMVAAASHRLNGASSTCAMTGLVPGVGYMVGLGQGDEERIPGDLSAPTLAILIEDYVQRKYDRLTGRFERPRYVGTWDYEGETYLDVSEQFFDIHEACNAARERGETAFYAVQADECILVGPQV